MTPKHNDFEVADVPWLPRHLRPLSLNPECCKLMGLRRGMPLSSRCRRENHRLHMMFGLPC
jgi:hypothetical protein